MALQIYYKRIGLVVLLLIVMIGSLFSFFSSKNDTKIDWEKLRKSKKFDQNDRGKWPLARDVPDTRNPYCRSKTYSNSLPSASIVMCFRNESALLLGRTVHSIFKRTPPELLDEIVLVDDNGDLDANDPYSLNSMEMEMMIAELKQLPKIKVIKNEKTEGLIRSRTIGADHVKSSEVIVFLDSHCEVNLNWLPPILERIKEDYTRVPIPVIDIISDTTFDYVAGGDSFRGGFSNLLDFQWIPIADWQKPNKTEDAILPRLTPAMPGGLFAMSRKFWEQSGKYDQGMDIWGGENIEMSVRVWQCGGSLEFIPCSRIGHMFRVNFKQFKENFPYSFPKGAASTVARNKARCLEVWFDEYKSHFYNSLFRSDSAPAYLNLGDLSERKNLRASLNCKSFGWYYKNIYPELALSQQ